MLRIRHTRTGSGQAGYRAPQSFCPAFSFRVRRNTRPFFRPVPSPVLGISDAMYYIASKRAMKLDPIPGKMKKLPLACLWKAAKEWLRRPGQDRITLEIERESRRRTVTTHCLKTPEYAEWLRSLWQQRPSRWIDDRTLYLNPACTGLDEAKELLKSRRPEQTVIVDMRNGIGFLFYALIAPLCPDVRWSFRQGTSLVPCLTHPEIPELKDMLPDIAPPEPNRKNIFLTGPSNLSHHESVLDFVRYAGLGYLVGTNTGGCTGPINYLPLPSGHEVAFTGTKVLSNLGRSGYFYRTGIRPDRYVEETADDIRLGRDAALEEALRIAGAPPSAGNP